MYRRMLARVMAGCALIAAMGFQAAPAPAATTHLQRIIYIMMENQGFDEVVGHDDANGKPDTPFITQLALSYGLETMSFGTTHPSLPNYLSLIGGSYYGIQDDNASCFAVPKQASCDTATGMNLVDLLEAHKLTWMAMEQTMPSAGYLGPQYPVASNGPVLYAQKHNPFVYYKDIATNPTRLKDILPLKNMNALAAVLASPATAPNFLFIVPDQCHDMHGTTNCSNYDALLRAGDAYVKDLVTTIAASKAFRDSNSALVISWDEDDYSSNIGCCESVNPHGGGHMATIVITPHYKKPIESAIPSNHYSELRSIEDAFGLPYLNESAKVLPSLLDLIP
jgi:phosphatidylinositol-3-phosphatase